MKILALLWTVCLVRLCYGGDDGKVDTSLFDVEEGQENGIKILRLTVKSGTSTNKLLFDGQTVWEEKNKPCSSAVLYMDKGGPTLAVIKTIGIKSGAEFTVYKYYNGKKWKKGNESNHKKKLKELQDAARPKESTETVGDNVEEKAKPANKPGDVPARRDPVKTVQHTPQAPSTNKPDTEDSPVVQQNLYTPTQQAVKPVTASSVQVDSTPITLDLANPDQSKADILRASRNEVEKRGTRDDDNGPYGGSKENLRNPNKPSGQSVASPQVKRGVEQSTNEASPEVTQDATTRQSTPTSEESRVPQPTGQPTITTPITLDLTKPDETKVNMDIKDSNGVVFSEITPKDGVLISSVVEGRTSVWRASGKEEFVFVKHHKKGDSILLTILLKDDNGYTDKYFKKADGKWNEIKQDEFNGKLATLMGEVLDLSNPDTSKILVHTETESGVSFQGYYPKDTSKITSVVDAGKELWTGGANDRCLSCLIYKKGSMELLKMVVVERLSMGWKCFEKSDGEWKDLTRDDFLNKLNEMRKSVSSSPDPSTTTPSQSPQ
ncbi:signal peptide-containing protein [Theileria equi strain WA]|uniref:Signal peptide-containing protein n=1 Tax=Theileria equi strain WA TaxID=1537102 RepID=L0AWM0_THEEQ|nr:signal peptide-containing protein [Theileria equi strain WA]AFZ79411.1 signal peptide-containing protein [Theileria equi strain WA]|eukprot:XP_004829077.1 signal peptide-containing protein [Theileria equi strain WA]